jgi:hypothetical protein
VADVHEEFEKQVLRAVAALYKSHPRTVNLGREIILVPPPHKNDPDFEERIASCDGTILWLHRNELVVGNLRESAHPTIINAQLSWHAYSILRKSDPAIPDPTLGHAAVRVTAEPGSMEEYVVAELIVRRLS